MREEEPDIRWKQRFQNFEKAYNLLTSAIGITKPSETERAGLIQFFEMGFELSWKMLKDFQEAEGFQVKSPREAIKQAFQSGYIKNGHIWMDALKDRNLTVHTYEEKTAIEIESKIRNEYYTVLTNLYEDFKKKMEC